VIGKIVLTMCMPGCIDILRREIDFVRAAEK